MKYRLLIFRFEFVLDRFLFPIIINHEDTSLAAREEEIIQLIIEKLNEKPSVEEVKLLHDRIDTIEKLEEEVRNVFGEITFDKIKTIDVELRRPVKVSSDDLKQGFIQSFEINNLHLPIRRLDNFNDIDLNPFVIIEYIEK